jgi:proteic killer suppression protein
MIHNFLTVGTEDIFNGNSTKSARKTLPPSLWRVAARNLDQLDSVQSLEELKVPPGNRLELHPEHPYSQLLQYIYFKLI